ncbi:Acid phosphatase PHO1 [Neolecta irregularis DAH-3]|uniref:Acid phosphatase PHO1 n=1 Tax=Neolecta irregularis (strain DAH-3) TaxID=1198029 RepID=A0A1U7LN77_NEOID|nr:Acid phosphatase PHO1 [Neolecta irregularis DAH-3]|eukprot:OLL24104.1 Acid phosphatase PHO1 [Neolecta irregularis DAH-3]
MFNYFQRQAQCYKVNVSYHEIRNAGEAAQNLPALKKYQMVMVSALVLSTIAFLGINVSSSFQQSSHFELFRNLGGLGPYIRGTGYGSKSEIPNGCVVDQIHMIARHGERYPTDAEGFDATAQKLMNFANFKGTLKPLRRWDWKNVIYDGLNQYGQLTATGPYAGTLTWSKAATEFRTRYPAIWNFSSTEPTRIFASDSTRVIQSAIHFAKNFFANQYESLVELVIISEQDQTGDTLSPTDACPAYMNEGLELGNEKFDTFTATYLPNIADRFNKQNPNLNLLPQDIYTMQEMCGYEINALGESPLCSVFEEEDWANFQYSRDLFFFYSCGPGNKYSITMGFPWINATRNLLLEGPRSGALFFSFTHDGSIVPMITVLGLFNDVELPSERRRRFKTTDIVPMGARLVLERLSCGSSINVRVLVNDAVIPIETCNSGPGSSCELGQFDALITKQGDRAGSFTSICGLTEGEDSISFLWQRKN